MIVNIKIKKSKAIVVGGLTKALDMAVDDIIKTFRTDTITLYVEKILSKESDSVKGCVIFKVKFGVKDRDKDSDDIIDRYRTGV